MSMHLVNIRVDNRSKNKKFRTSNQAKASRKSKSDWQALLDKYGVNPEKKKRKVLTSYSLEIPELRRTAEIPSLNSDFYSVTKQESPIYSGDAIIGLSVLHKSNAVPVTRHQDILEISKMRRG